MPEAGAAVRERLATGLRAFDKAFERRLRHAVQQGELAADADPAMLARVASALLHSIALRARRRAACGVRATAVAGVALICGTAAQTNATSKPPANRC